MPDQYMNYKHALLMYNLIRKCSPDEEFMQLNFQANLNPRIKHQNFFQIQNYNVGHNILIKRLASLNDKIEQSWLSLSYSTFKIKCKSLFLTIWQFTKLLLVEPLLIQVIKDSIKYTKQQSYLIKLQN